MPFSRPYRLLSAALGVILLSASGPSARADWISDWNELALDAGRNSNELSPEISRSMAMLSTAMYNSLEGISGNYNLYTQGSYSGPSGNAAPGASFQAATSAAAYTVLSGLYQSMEPAFFTLYQNQLTSLGGDPGLISGINFGTLVGNDILNWRATDGAAVASDPNLYSSVGSAGHWSEASTDTALLPGWGSVSTFAIASTTGFSGTLGMSNTAYIATSAYATDYNTVKDIGSASSGTRTLPQTQAALFWHGAQGTTSNVGIWNSIAEGIVTSQGLSLDETARLYAALNVAMADAAIVALDTKYSVDFWTPEQAIQNGGADSNALTIADPAWAALLGTEEMPSYFAQQGIFAGSAVPILELFAGTNYAFTIEFDTDGDGINDMTRTFSSLADALAEATYSSVWGGLSFEKDALDAASAGNQIANTVMNSQFAPVPEPAGALLLGIAGILSIARRRRR
ncbi:MAG: PEP-CTERM sorting domain-containing protein [Verrucomicrobiota bacterium]